MVENSLKRFAAKHATSVFGSLSAAGERQSSTRPASTFFRKARSPSSGGAPVSLRTTSTTKRTRAGASTSLTLASP